MSYASVDEVDAAVASARKAADHWGSRSLASRAATLFAFREQLLAGADELAAVITSEHGKVLADAAGEIKRGLEVTEFACGIPHLLSGELSRQVSTGVDVWSTRHPLGVTAVISPFNFPAMVPLWFVPLAIATGNSVVLKPSEKDPSAADVLARMWSRAGLPAGVFNVVHGDKVAVDRLLVHRDVDGISFVGSTSVARYVYETSTAHGKRVQALGGAKNHLLVMPDADLDAAAQAAVNAGFGSAGERCMAISVVVAVDQIADELADETKRRMKSIRVGDGRRECDMGPLVSREHRDRVLSYIDAGVTDGAELVVDGRGVDVDGDPGGFWVGPTLFDHVTEEMSIYADEIFGPVLCIVRVPSFDAGVELINANPYGNGAAIFTASGAAAQQFESAAKIGMIGVNIPIPVPVAQHSFGGWKASLFGDTHAYGPDGVRFFTRGKVVTSRWPDTSKTRDRQVQQQQTDMRFPVTAE